MAENCIFCGKAVTFFSGCTLSCGGVDQPVCGECAEKYIRETKLQRARLALETGRAREPKKLMTYIGQEERRQQEREVWREKASRCPACGGEMELKLENFSIGADGGGGLMTLLADTYEVDLYACPVCGKVELYTAGFFQKKCQEEDGEPEEAEEPEQTEPKDDSVFGFGKRKDKRPPWEK